MDPATFCFLCGQPVTYPPRLHRLSNGEACPACRDRALEVLPPALPARPEAWALDEEEDPSLGYPFEGFRGDEDGPRRA